LLRAQVGKEEAVQKLRELELKRKRADLVPMADAEEAICEVLRALRPLLDSLPKLTAQDANPSNPEMAEEALREGLEKVHQMIDNHLNDGAD
jgi:molecular chaperone GrpE (heat shock protein)